MMMGYDDGIVEVQTTKVGVYNIQNDVTILSLVQYAVIFHGNRNQNTPATFLLQTEKDLRKRKLIRPQRSVAQHI